ncbi:hypothetical protein [Sinosporangium album]|uniref:hypothetical protein n=1 Tax=Sinosporangium album TaxID=504805 RepID=UPI00115FE222|nr:hypothetical protein [Sinosporangium album]
MARARPRNAVRRAPRYGVRSGDADGVEEGVFDPVGGVGVAFGVGVDQGGRAGEAGVEAVRPVPAAGLVADAVAPAGGVEVDEDVALLVGDLADRPGAAPAVAAK